MRRTDPSDWMWTEACDLIEQAERMHRRFFRLNATGPAHAAWEPPVDLFEDEHEVIIVAWECRRAIGFLGSIKTATA